DPTRDTPPPRAARTNTPRRHRPRLGPPAGWVTGRFSINSGGGLDRWLRSRSSHTAGFVVIVAIREASAAVGLRIAGADRAFAAVTASYSGVRVGAPRETLADASAAAVARPP